MHPGRIKFALFDVNGNLINDKYQTSKQIIQHTDLIISVERQVLKLVGKWLVESPVRSDPVTCAEKEEEGEFDFDAAMANYEKMMQEVHGPTAAQAQQQAQSQVKADKKKKRKK